MICPNCGKKMKRYIKDSYKYTGCGLDNIILENIPAFICPSCDEEVITIPDIHSLHKLIAFSLIKYPNLLQPKEIKFLRKLLALSGLELAAILGLTNVTISRWETGIDKISVSHDRFLRLLVLCSCFPEIKRIKVIETLKNAPIRKPTKTVKKPKPIRVDVKKAEKELEKLAA